MDARARRLTSTGPSALAVWRITGRDAGLALESLSGRRLSAPGGLRLERLSFAGAPIDEAVVAMDEDGRGLELSTHGGAAVESALLSAFAALGIPVLDDHDPPDSRFEHEYERALAAAPGEHVLARVADAREPLRREIAACADSMLDCGPGLRERLAILLRRDALIRQVECPPRVALVGPSNAGKSSLANALAGSDLAITSPSPGTTRDILEIPALVRGLPVVLLDGAGAREAPSATEREGQARFRSAAQSADLRLLVLRADLLEQEPRTIDVGPAAFCVLTHLDVSRPKHVPEGLAAVPVSSKTGEGLDLLRTAIWARIASCDLFGPGVPCLFSSRQRSLLAEAMDAIEKHPARARELLLEILG